MANEEPPPIQTGYQISTFSTDEPGRSDVLEDHLDSEEVVEALQALIEANYLVEDPKRRLVVIYVVTYIEDR